jgi:hypothetical protein
MYKAALEIRVVPLAQVVRLQREVQFPRAISTASNDGIRENGPAGVLEYRWGERGVSPQMSGAGLPLLVGPGRNVPINKSLANQKQSE